MVQKMNKRSVLALLVIFMLVICCMAYASYAYLTYVSGGPIEYVIGDVDANLSIYFEKDGKQYTLESTDIEIEYEGIDPNGVDILFTKSGVIKVNISDRDAIQFAENLRVNLNVNSDVPTYVRIAVYEQLTLTYISGGITREVAVVQPELTDFNYNFGNGKFYDNRSKDGFIYYTKQVKQNDDKTTFTIPLILEYYTDRQFGTRANKYSLQIGFIVEAVQYLDGAQNNWGYETAPWGEDW